MPLVDTGLVVRYYLDEAASGTTPSAVEDASGNGYDLTEINYGSGNMAYTEVSGNRGLESSATTGAQRARRGINNTSDALRDALAGSQGITVEIVVRADAFSASQTRIFAINNRAGGQSVLGIGATAGTNWVFCWEGTIIATGNLGTGSRTVIHVVYDTMQGTANNRLRVWQDDSEVSLSYPSSISDSDTLTIPSDVDLIALNRESSGSFDRSMDGVLFYAAIYDHAFSTADIAQNYAILASDDDAPVAPPTSNRRRRLLMACGS